MQLQQGRGHSQPMSPSLFPRLLAPANPGTAGTRHMPKPRGCGHASAAGNGPLHPGHGPTARPRSAGLGLPHARVPTLSLGTWGDSPQCPQPCWAAGSGLLLGQPGHTGDSPGTARMHWGQRGHPGDSRDALGTSGMCWRNSLGGSRDTSRTAGTHQGHARDSQDAVGTLGTHQGHARMQWEHWGQPGCSGDSRDTQGTGGWDEGQWGTHRGQPGHGGESLGAPGDSGDTPGTGGMCWGRTG